MKLKLDQIRIVGGNRVEYDYSYPTSLAKYFSQEKFYVEYDREISEIPLSILVIPFLANMIPIAWFVGFEVEVDEVDHTFYDSLLNLKKEFRVHFPTIKNVSNLQAPQLKENIFDGSNSALLFSGGLDSFESLTRHIQENPFLVSVRGADIEISDKKRWNEFKTFNTEEKILNEERLLYVTSNLRSFYTYEVDLLVSTGWWGQIQHGIALLSLLAPLSALLQITTIYIASSNTGEVSFGWGSTLETDEKVKWANQKTVHDGFHLRRTQKIENIITFAEQTQNYIKLRVCYSEWREGYNCSRCAKCQRTMLGFILAGENPENYGFKIPDDFYKLIFKNFTESSTFTTGVLYEWRCLQEKAAGSSKYFYKFNAAEEKEITTFSKLDLSKYQTKNIKVITTFQRRLFIFRNKYPNLYRSYLQLRKKL